MFWILACTTADTDTEMLLLQERLNEAEAGLEEMRSRIDGLEAASGAVTVLRTDDDAEVDVLGVRIAAAEVAIVSLTEAVSAVDAEVGTINDILDDILDGEEPVVVSETYRCVTECDVAVTPAPVPLAPNLPMRLQDTGPILLQASFTYIGASASALARLSMACENAGEIDGDPVIIPYGSIIDEDENTASVVMVFDPTMSDTCDVRLFVESGTAYGTTLTVTNVVLSALQAGS